MCTTCGCGIGQTRINGKSIRQRTRSYKPTRYRTYTHNAIHLHALTPTPPTNFNPEHNQDVLHFGTGMAGSHAPGMSQARMVKIEQDILAKNNNYANKNRHYFNERGIFSLNLVSSPGSGKTSLLVKTIEALYGKQPIVVIEGDQQTNHDAARIRTTGVSALQINTGKGCHLDAHMIDQAIQQLNLQNNSLLLIENVGNLVCPASFDLGESHKVVILSVTEGEDKPLKYPDMFRAADLMLLNKCDLLPYLSFDVELAIEYAHRINPMLPVIQISATDGTGMQSWLDWIDAGCRRTITMKQPIKQEENQLG